MIKASYAILPLSEQTIGLAPIEAPQCGGSAHFRARMAQFCAQMAYFCARMVKFATHCDPNSRPKPRITCQSVAA
jgi:hypothetical protein